MDDTDEHKVANKGASRYQMPVQNKALLLRMSGNIKTVSRWKCCSPERLTVGRCSGFFLSMPLISVFLSL